MNTFENRFDDTLLIFRCLAGSRESARGADGTRGQYFDGGPSGSAALYSRRFWKVCFPLEVGPFLASGATAAVEAAVEAAAGGGVDSPQPVDTDARTVERTRP